MCKKNCVCPGLVVNMNTVNAFKRKKISMEWMESGESEDYDDDTDDSGDEDSVHKYVTRRSSFTSRKRYDQLSHSFCGTQLVPHSTSYELLEIY